MTVDRKAIGEAVRDDDDRTDDRKTKTEKKQQQTDRIGYRSCFGPPI